MSNPLTTARQALLTVLQNDATLVSFLAKGRLYTFDDGAFAPRKITPSDCPCLAVYPGRMPHQWATEAKQEIDYALECIGYVAGRVAADAEQLYWNIYEAAYAGFPDLSQSNVTGIRFASPSISAEPAAGKTADFWKVSFRIVITIREQIL